VLLTKYLYSDLIKEDEMCGSYRTYEKREKTYILAREPEREKLRGISKG
jgi:hypothetical protein